jgi:hypothetical protein
VPGKEERTGAHRNGKSTVRPCKRRRAAAFVGGEGAPVVTGGGDEVLQLGTGEGMRDLQEILGIGSSREGDGEEWGWENEWSSASGERAARRQRDRGERGGKRWGPGRGGATRRGGAMGPSPDRRTMPGSSPSAALAGDVRRARACRPDRAGREGADGWATAQCRASVPLTGGAGLSPGAV